MIGEKRVVSFWRLDFSRSHWRAFDWVRVSVCISESLDSGCRVLVELSICVFSTGNIESIISVGVLLSRSQCWERSSIEKEAVFSSKFNGLKVFRTALQTCTSHGSKSVSGVPDEEEVE